MVDSSLPAYLPTYPSQEDSFDSKDNVKMKSQLKHKEKHIGIKIGIKNWGSCVRPAIHLHRSGSVTATITSFIVVLCCVRYIRVEYWHYSCNEIIKQYYATLKMKSLIWHKLLFTAMYKVLLQFADYHIHVKEWGKVQLFTQGNWNSKSTNFNYYINCRHQQTVIGWYYYNLSTFITMKIQIQQRKIR